MAINEQNLVKCLTAANKIGEKIVQIITVLNGEHVGKKNVTTAELCEIYVVTKRINDTIEEARKLLTKQVQDHLKFEKIPGRFDDEDITTFTTKSGWRVVCNQMMSVSIIPEKKEEAFKWLREHDLGPLIVPTVNAQTLSAAARNYLETENKEFPADIFKASTTPSLSVTQVKSKRAPASK